MSKLGRELKKFFGKLVGFDGFEEGEEEEEDDDVWVK